jgi:hypothetical protein
MGGEPKSTLSFGVFLPIMDVPLSSSAFGNIQDFRLSCFSSMHFTEILRLLMIHFGRCGCTAQSVFRVEKGLG